MRRNEEKLLALDFEGILKFLGNEVFDCYKVGVFSVCALFESSLQPVYC